MNTFDEFVDELYKNTVNIVLAAWYLSEAGMDLMYASGKTDNMSLRIGHMRMW